MDALRLSVPQLLAHIPIMIGFAPRESVVILGLGARGEVLLAMRIDRDACWMGNEVGPEVAQQLFSTGAVTAVLVSFTSEDVRLACPALDALRPAVARVCDQVETWAVVDGRFFSPGCADPACCPDGGTPVPEWPERVAVPRWSRGPVEVAAAGWWCEREDGLRTWRGASARRWDRAMRAASIGATRPGARGAGRLIASLGDVHVRDYVLLRTIGAGARACREALAGGPSDAVAEALDAVLDPRSVLVPDARVACLDALFHDLLATAVGQRRAPLAALRCVIAWWGDDGVAAARACEEALAADSTYRLAALLDVALARDIPPGWCRA